MGIFLVPVARVPGDWKIGPLAAGTGRGCQLAIWIGLLTVCTSLGWCRLAAAELESDPNGPCVF